MASLFNQAFGSAASLACLGLTLPAYAQEKAGGNSGVIATPPQILTSAKKLDDASLAGTRGGQAVVVGKQTLTSTITGSTINGNYAAGPISFSGSALSGFSGMGNVVVNTGAQANLQSAMNLTINLGK